MERDDPSALSSMPAPAAPSITLEQVRALQDWARALPESNIRAAMVRYYLNGIAAALLGASHQHVRESCNLIVS